MKFRYIINGKFYDWQNCNDVSIAKMNYVAMQLTKDFGNNWNIEYRGE